MPFLLYHGQLTPPGVYYPPPPSLGGYMSKFRRKMSMRSSKKDFRRKASRTHRKNVAPAPMRGGIRA